MTLRIWQFLVWHSVWNGNLLLYGWVFDSLLPPKDRAVGGWPCEKPLDPVGPLSCSLLCTNTHTIVILYYSLIPLNQYNKISMLLTLNSPYFPIMSSLSKSKSQTGPHKDRGTRSHTQNSVCLRIALIAPQLYLSSQAKYNSALVPAYKSTESILLVFIETWVKLQM